jgi:predicted DNA-binding transcriptional regulator AlpA
MNDQTQSSPDSGLLRLAQVLTVIPISRSSWLQGVTDGKYPRPIKLGRISLWRAEDIHQFIAALDQESKPAVYGEVDG